MIQNTFLILDGIGESLERRLWKEGVLTWSDFIKSPELLGFSTERKRLFDESLFRYRNELEKCNARYFHRSVRRREHWRLFDRFREFSVCLDIETNGLQPQHGGYVTLIGLYDGFEYMSFLRGENLSGENLKRELSRYKCLITFYGSVFDIPFLQRTFPDVEFDIPHFDLCFAARKLNMHGGLKKLERDLSIVRDEAVNGLNGYDAVRLWSEAQEGSSEALDLLIQYNRQDTVNLMEMASIFYKRLRNETGIGHYLSSGTA